MAFAYQNPLVTNIALLPVHKSDDSNSNKVNVYSAVSLLPIVLILVVLLSIYTICKVKRWKKDKKQIVQLAKFYDSIECSTECCGKHQTSFVRSGAFSCNHEHASTNKYNNHTNNNNKYSIDKISYQENQECDRLRRALLVPCAEPTPFYQPIGTFKNLHTSLPTSSRSFIVQ